MPFRRSFDCLWCGRSHTARTGDDLEGWAHLCPACIGRAGENGFIRFRVHAALTERGAARAAQGDGGTSDLAGPSSPGAPPPTPQERPAPRSAPSPAPGVADLDDWYLRRGRHSRGPIHDAAWNAELDAAGRWLDELPLSGDIVELGAGTGWWAPLLAGKGELSLYDDRPEALDRARDRLVAHRLRAHLHVRGVREEPDRRVDVVFAAFWLGWSDAGQRESLLEVAHRWLRPGGTLVLIERAVDPHGATDGVTTPNPDQGIVPPPESAAPAGLDAGALRAALVRHGFEVQDVVATGRFFLLASATAGS